MSELVSETIYKDLKERGLDIATPTILVLPEQEIKKPTLFGKLTGILTGDQNPKNHNSIIAFPILNSAILVIHNSVIYVYKYTIDEETSQLMVKHHHTVSWRYNAIEKIHECPGKYVRDRNDIPILMESNNGFGLFVFDLKEFQLHEKNYIHKSGIISMSMITDKQAVVIDRPGYIYNYSINHGVISQKNYDKVNLVIKKTQIFKKAWILHEVDEQIQSLITLFYIVTLPPNHQKIALRVKEMWRTIDGQIHFQDVSDYCLETDSLMYRDDLCLRSVGNYYCLQVGSQILVIKKKFNKYMILDSLNQRFIDHSLFINKNGIVTSIGQNVIELNFIKFSDPKSVYRICDVIDLPSSLCGFKDHFIEVWPILNSSRQYTLVLTFIKGQEIFLANIHKMEPLQKMIELVNVKHKPLEVVRDLAVNLGISTKKFYLKLWSQSPKLNHDIYKYLLPCEDVTSIKKQLKSLLRRRTVPVSQMLKIFDKISLILVESLRGSMSQTNLRQYVKNDFLRRKMKLNEVNKQLDHRIFDKIYQSSILSTIVEFIGGQIDPAEIKIDPLHAMVDQTPSKQLRSLENVFQQFKLIILEDYKDFLIEIFQKFPGKILQVLNSFSFLLPNYPFEINVQKPSKINQPIIKNLQDINNCSQQVWFQEVTVSQWNGEITKQRILKEFHYDHQTSKILEAVDQFINSLYGRESKRGKHGLISLDLQQYTQKVNQLQGIRLYLQVCQYANKESLEKNEDPQISAKILQILQKKNKLASPDYDYCLLYSRMHYFMLKYEIIEKEKLSINQLTKLKPQSLVALFFLENKQRKEYIFRDFMQLYHDKSQFEDVLRKFVQSQNCSKIQLEILMKQIIDMGLNFQRENQEIIQVLLIGQCMKLQIRENPAILENEHNAQHMNLIDNLQISKGLAFKINKIKQLRKCQDIFKNFKCQKMTYEQLLALEQNYGIFKLLMNKYFNQEITDYFLEIQEEPIDLNYPRNMLTILIYLQETVYYDVKPFDIYIQYGLVLLQWKEFEVIENLLKEDYAFDAFQINANQFIETLIKRALDNIYLDQEIIYDQETKEQIINTVGILPDDSPLKIQQLAKLQLASILQSWDCTVHCSDIFTICHEWGQARRQQFIEDLILKYSEKLTFQTFQAIYTELEIIDQKQTQINIYNEQYVQFCAIYANKLLEDGRYREVIEVLTFIKSLANVPINYGLQSEAFLKSILNIYPQNIQMGRKMIEFFLENNKPQSDYKVKQLFQTYFDETILSLWQRQQSISVSPNYFYRQATGQCFYKLDDLWQLAQKDTTKIQQIYYNYYFLLSALINSNSGLTKIYGISYNLDKITDLILIHIDNFNRDKKQLWIINFDEILEKYLKGLAGLAVQRLDVGHEIQGTSKLQTILDLLKQNREQNNDLIKSLTRVKQQIKSKLKRTERKDRFYGLLDQIAEEQQKQRKTMELLAAQNKIVEEPKEEQIFLSWKKIEDEKKNISSRSLCFISEKDLIEGVFEFLGDNEKQVQIKPTNRVSILNNLFLPTINSPQNIDLLVDMFRKGEFERAKNYSPILVQEALKRVYTNNPEINSYQLVDLMENMKIGDPRKIQIFKLTKYFSGSLTNKQLNTLFNFDFFTKPLEVEEDFKYATIYEELQPRIKQIIKDITPDGLKDLAHLLGNCLQSTQYSALVFFETLLYLSEHSSFTSNSAIIAQECVLGLGEYPEIIVNRYQYLLENNYIDQELKIYLRENLFRLMQDKGYDEIAKSIKAY